jgi:hypothetical protein
MTNFYFFNLGEMYDIHWRLLAAYDQKAWLIVLCVGFTLVANCPRMRPAPSDDIHTYLTQSNGVIFPSIDDYSAHLCLSIRS